MSLLQSRIDQCSLKIGDLIGNHEPEPIGKIERFVMYGDDYFGCVVDGKTYPVSEVYYCPFPEEYESKLAKFRSHYQELGTPGSWARNDEQATKKHREAFARWKAMKKEIGRSKSGRKF